MPCVICCVKISPKIQYIEHFFLKKNGASKIKILLTSKRRSVPSGARWPFDWRGAHLSGGGLSLYPWSVATTSNGLLAAAALASPRAAARPALAPLLPGQAISPPLPFPSPPLPVPVGELQWRVLHGRGPLASCSSSSSSPTSSPAAALPGEAAREHRCTRRPSSTRITPARSPGDPGRHPTSPFHRSVVLPVCHLDFIENKWDVSDWWSMVLVRPRVFLYKHFLSDDEANHLISLVSATLPPSHPQNLVFASR